MRIGASFYLFYPVRQATNWNEWVQSNVLLSKRAPRTTTDCSAVTALIFEKVRFHLFIIEFHEIRFWIWVQLCIKYFRRKIFLMIFLNIVLCNIKGVQYFVLLYTFQWSIKNVSVRWPLQQVLWFLEYILRKPIEG